MAIDIQTAVKSRVVFVGGNDSYARSEALHKLLELAGGEPEETESLQADSSEPSDWIATVSTVPFFSERRVMVVRSIGRCDLEKIWEEKIGKTHPAVQMLASIPETGFLVLVHDDEAGNEERQKKIGAKAVLWSKLVTLCGGCTLILDIDPSKTIALVNSRAASHGKTISPRAATLLCEMVGSKPSLATSEVDKLALYIGDEPQIRESDVKTVVAPDSEYNVFQLVDAIVAGNSTLAVTQLRVLFAQTPDVAGQVFPRVFPILLGQFRLIWQARFCLDEGTNPLHPDPSVSQWFGTKKLTSEPGWKQGRCVQSAKKLSLAKIRVCLGYLVDADSEIKGQKASISLTDSVERMALQLCKVCSGKS